MANYTGSDCRICRRENVKLFLKGDRCYSDKCAFDRRSYPPGEHGERRGRKTSDYGIQLREKQKIKRIYGLSEQQFRNTFEKVASLPGVTCEVTSSITMSTCLPGHQPPRPYHQVPYWFGTVPSSIWFMQPSEVPALGKLRTLSVPLTLKW